MNLIKNGHFQEMETVMPAHPFDRRNFLKHTAAILTAAGSAPIAGHGAEMRNRYEPTWESLDAHPCPDWYRDARVGMYFHWGPSSVPGWAPRSGGTPYAEWYWNAMEDEKNPTRDYHRITWGADFPYEKFFDLFRGRLYHPEEWTSLARRAGARYVFMNAKHHDGFCMWPSAVTHRTAGHMGPKRDILGQFVRAARKDGLKAGFYYSFYEWFNPLYTGKEQPYAGLIPARDYVDDFMVPQVRELIDRYDPDFLYFDGEWDRPADFWKSRGLAAYYYNRAAERGREVLLNDRYGKGDRGRHGDVYNVEYEYGAENEGLLTHPWSYWRGIAKTFGWNRDTDPEDCLSPGELIRMLVNGVSRNGNFDINVGPTGDGAITDLERLPLETLGGWLGINGEAVYGSRPWKIQADGDIRFTTKDGWVYAIFLKWQGERFRIRSLRAVEGSTVTMLGSPGALEWRREDEGMTIEYPLHRARPSACAHAWTFKIRPS